MTGELIREVRRQRAEGWTLYQIKVYHNISYEIVKRILGEA